MAKAERGDWKLLLLFFEGRILQIDFRMGNFCKFFTDRFYYTPNCFDNFILDFYFYVL